MNTAAIQLILILTAWVMTLLWCVRGLTYWWSHIDKCKKTYKKILLTVLCGPLTWIATLFILIFVEGIYDNSARFLKWLEKG